MEIDKSLLQRVAQNSRLLLTDQEIQQFLKELREILKTFSELDKVKTDNVLPSFQPVPIKNVMREDAAKPCLSQDDSLKNSPATANGYFKGPRAI
jgi:aspartyl-tRNA(Asn)/glutamyl-tRNA(Gln) amidotransferase subunit C